MEILSTADTLFLKLLATGTVAYVSNSYIKQWRRTEVEPLIPAKKSLARKSTKALPSTRNIKRALEQTEKQCVVFYGSQTGTAEKLALQFSKDASTRFGLQCLVADTDDYDYEELLNLPDSFAVVFILATYGEGEPTDNAVGFNRYIQNLSEDSHSSEPTLHYAAFGLGNSSYQFYNQMVKNIDCHLAKKGAHRIGLVGMGDDGKGSLEEDFLAWKDMILPQIASRYLLQERPYTFQPSFQIDVTSNLPSSDTFLGETNKSHLRGKSKGPYTLSNPYAAQISKIYDLCPSGPRRIIHAEFDLSASTLTYESGDHLAIRPVNSNLEVDRFLFVFGLISSRDQELRISSNDPAIRVPVPNPTTLDALTRYYLDICAPVSRQLLHMLSKFAPNEISRLKLVALSSSETFQKEVLAPRLNLAQVLELCERSTRWTNVPLSLLLENLAIMKPRYYSISSSPRVSRKHVTTTTVVETARLEGYEAEFKGVASNYLLAMSQAGDNAFSAPTHETRGPRERFSIPTGLVHIRRSNFKLPRRPEVPIIMIGPGTGVAPFRGFIQDRVEQYKEGRTVGRTILFYGCRKKNEDFIYQNEWQEYQKILTPETFSMHVAFSRQDPERKVYVQHLLQRHAQELRKLILQDGAHVYVCGDAHRMARDVFRSMSEIIAVDGKFHGIQSEAETYLKEMKRGGRWLEDVW